jgi:AraC family transcriptional regulator
MSRRIEVELRSVSGARVMRVTDGARLEVPQHAHAWPLISTYVIGSYRNGCALGEMFIESPSVVFYQAGESHVNQIGAEGLEQIDIEFDPEWLGYDELNKLGPVHRWIGGRHASAARRLAKLWITGAAEDELRAATRAFLMRASSTSQSALPTWFAHVRGRLSPEFSIDTRRLANELRCHPSWLAQAYRNASGEGIAETVRRRRVERAVNLLRTSSLPAAAIAAEAGFCDQSHMIRIFKTFLGRTPAQVRAEWLQS